MFMAAPAYAYQITGTLSTGPGVTPAIPTGLKTSSPVPGDTSITIHWDSVASVGGYHLYRIVGASTTPAVLIASTTSTSYTDTGLSDGVYSYQVESYLATLTSAKSAPTAPVTISTAVAPSDGNSGSTGSAGGTSGYTSFTTTTATTTVPGVFNILDFNTLVTHWGQHVTGGATDGDFTGVGGVPDGVVNILDFNFLITHWNQTK